MQLEARNLKNATRTKRPVSSSTRLAKAKLPKKRACMAMSRLSTTRQPSGPSARRDQKGVAIIEEMTPAPRMSPTWDSEKCSESVRTRLINLPWDAKTAKKARYSHRERSFHLRPK